MTPKQRLAIKEAQREKRVRYYAKTLASAIKVEVSVEDDAWRRERMKRCCQRQRGRIDETTIHTQSGNKQRKRQANDRGWKPERGKGWAREQETGK